MSVLLDAADVLALLVAVAAAAGGGAAFVKGVVEVATWLRLPRMLVATTLAAFATSSPELSVSTLAALAGRPGIGLGDALGSNVVNLGLILGAALMFGPLAARIEDFRRDFVLALSVPVLIWVLVFDGSLSRADGALLLVVLAAWLALAALDALVSRRKAPVVAGPPVRPARAWLLLFAGLALLIVAGRLFVSGSAGIAAALGVHPYVIGATVVSIGTSLPELVTVLISRMKGHDDVGLGTLLGSNLFNGLGIVGVAASIHPIDVPLGEVSVALAFGVATVLLMLPRAGMLSRRRGVALVATYIAFVALTAASAR
jgi:cation:H+ antiporter